MATNKEYSVTELYQWLKLDIWRSAQVAHWGHVQKVTVRTFDARPINATRRKH